MNKLARRQAFGSPAAIGGLPEEVQRGPAEVRDKRKPPARRATKPGWR